MRKRELKIRAEELRELSGNLPRNVVMGRALQLLEAATGVDLLEPLCERYGEPKERTPESVREAAEEYREANVRVAEARERSRETAEEVEEVRRERDPGPEKGESAAGKVRRAEERVRSVGGFDAQSTARARAREEAERLSSGPLEVAVETEPAPREWVTVKAEGGVNVEFRDPRAGEESAEEGPVDLSEASGPPEKWCPMCKERRSVKEFGTDGRTSDGRSKTCARHGPRKGALPPGETGDPVMHRDRGDVGAFDRVGPARKEETTDCRKARMCLEFPTRQKPGKRVPGLKHGLCPRCAKAAGLPAS